MKLFAKIFASIVALIVAAFIGLSIFVGTLDADKYRPQLVEKIAQVTGRTAKLNGPIKFSMGLSGVKISIQDASIANPAWASRPTMAGMGKFELAVGLLPLLAHQISVNELSIENADILLETSASNQHNWDFGRVATNAKTPNKYPEERASVSPVSSLKIDSLTITNSQLAMRGADGKISSVNVRNMHLGMGASGAELVFNGEANATPITLTMKTSMADLLSKAPFNFAADLTYAAFHLTAQGKADPESSRADITAYNLTAGSTKITGNASATWGGVHPALHGTLTSDKVNMADFKPQGGDDVAPAAAQSEAPVTSKRLFSTAPLPLDGLKAADADLDVSVGEFPMGKDSLKKVSAKLVLSNGDLSLSPVKAYVGDAPVDVQVKINASQSPAHVTVGIISQNVDLGDLQKLGGMSPFMTGKASANIQLAGDGNSAHDIASSLGGVVTITAEKGEIITGAAAGVSSALAAIFSSQGGDDALNCLAARFLVKNGVMNDNGILIDSAASTVAGKGNVNLSSELVDLTLRAKTKLVNVGDFVPPLEISGALNDPHYKVDAAGVVKNVVGSLLGGGAMPSSSVPDIQAAPADQNACVYTLDHPKAAKASSTILPADPVAKAGQQIQNISNGLKGLFGH